MENKMKGVLLGVGGLVLWFTPFVYVEFRGVDAYQSGQHIGGIAYLLLLASIAYAALSWVEQYQLAVVAASVATGVCALFALQAWTSIGWGLALLLIVSVRSIVFAVRSNKVKTANSKVAEV